MSVILGENKLSNIIKTDAGTGGTTNYVDLDNKPSINGVELVGDKTSADLGLETQQIDAYTKDETNAAIASAITGKADINYVDNQLNLKADKVNTYTKSEVDSAISNNLTIINNKLNNKADKSETYTKDETVQVIQSNIVGKADISYVDSELSTKADKSDTYTKTEIDNLLDNPTITGDTYPIGAIAPYAGTTVPQNWLLCDGREVSRTTYSELFAAIGTVWGAGDGSTSFNLPDFTDKFALGAGGDVDLAETGGEKAVTLTVNQMPAHAHALFRGFDGPNKIFVPTGTVKKATWNTYDDQSASSMSSTGGGKAHNNMPPYVGSYYIIKAKQSAGVIATVVDTLASTSATDALSAKQGKILNDRITALSAKLNKVLE